MWQWYVHGRKRFLCVYKGDEQVGAFLRLAKKRCSLFIAAFSFVVRQFTEKASRSGCQDAFYFVSTAKNASGLQVQVWCGPRSTLNMLLLTEKRVWVETLTAAFLNIAVRLWFRCQSLFLNPYFIWLAANNVEFSGFCAVLCDNRFSPSQSGCRTECAVRKKIITKRNLWNSEAVKDERFYGEGLL